MGFIEFMEQHDPLAPTAVVSQRISPKLSFQLNAYFLNSDDIYPFLENRISLICSHLAKYLPLY